MFKPQRILFLWGCFSFCYIFLLFRLSPAAFSQQVLFLVSKTYKLQKEVADSFAEACDKIGVSKKSQLEKMMMEFVDQVNKDN